jgi:hypothetical protein
MSLNYLCFGGIWFAMCITNWKDLIELQMWISAVVFLGMVDSALRYGDYLDWNKVGVGNDGGYWRVMPLRSGGTVVCDL